MRDIRIPAQATAADLEAAYAKGMLRKEQLVHGAYYRGHCRNAQIARWNATEQQFAYLRSKFNQTFIEFIRHPVDENRYDVFVPIEQAEPTPEQIIDDRHMGPLNLPTLGRPAT